MTRATSQELNYSWMAASHRCSEPIADRTMARSVFDQVKLATPFRAALLTGRVLPFDWPSVSLLGLTDIRSARISARGLSRVIIPHPSFESSTPDRIVST